MKMHKALGKVAAARSLLCPAVKSGGRSLTAEDIAKIKRDLTGDFCTR